MGGTLEQSAGTARVSGSPSRRRGIFFADVAMGLALVVLLTVSLLVIIGRQHQATWRLADTRAAQRLAESVLLDLHAGQPPRQLPRGEEEFTVEVTRLDPGGPAGRMWVRADVTYRSGSASVLGLVPSDAELPKVRSEDAEKQP